MAIDTTKEYFVLVAEFDFTEEAAKRFGHDRRGPIAWEAYLDQPMTLEQAKESARHLQRVGEVRIAKLQFVE